MWSAVVEMSTALASNVKSALLKGWRERWPDEHWSVAVKQHFPQGSSGDVCQLAGELVLCRLLIVSGFNPEHKGI